MSKPIIQANSYMTEITNLSVIDINSYHSDDVSELAQDLKRQPLSKPIIIVADPAHSDGSHTGQNASDADLFARTAKAAGQHFEHLALTIDMRIESCSTKGIGWADMTLDERQCLRNLSKYATLLAPGGNLTTGKDGAGRGRLYWNGSPFTLVAFSAYGSLVSNQVDHIAWLDALDLHKPKPDGSTAGVNGTRLWLVDGWAAIKSGCPGLPPLAFTGLTPFAETGVGLSERYDLNALNDAMFSRLRAYVQAAWDRGIVCIVTLYDRNGLTKRSTTNYSTWDGSPWNEKNNKSALMKTTADHAVPMDFLSSSCGGNAQVALWHRAYVQRVVAELAPYGNCIIEVINEAEAKSAPDLAWNARLPAFHAGIGATIKGVPAVCPAPPPPPQPPPPAKPCGDPNVKCWPGVFLASSPKTPKFHFNWHLPVAKKYRALRLDFKLKVGPWDPTPDKVHNLVWVRKGLKWANMLFYSNGVEGSNVMRFASNMGGGGTRDKKPSVLPGQTYKVHIEYDLITRRAAWQQIRKMDGTMLNEIVLPVYGLSFTDNLFQFDFGSQPEGEGPEANTYGWVWSDGKAELVP